MVSLEKDQSFAYAILESSQSSDQSILFIYRKSEMSCEREQAATPTFERLDVNWDELNESAISGYDGDKEDEGESFMEGGM